MARRELRSTPRRDPVFNLSPGGIIRDLDLLRPIYSATSCLGHFGPWRDPAGYRWERTDRTQELRRAFEGHVRTRRNGSAEPETGALTVHHKGAA